MALRVLHVVQPNLVGGLTQYVENLVSDQTRRGWRAVVACPAEGVLAPRLGAIGVEHRRWDAVRDPTPALVSELRSLRRIVHDVRPDVVHLHSSKAGLVGRLALRGRYPTIFSPHAWSFFAVRGGTRRLVLAWERAGAHLATIVMCGSVDEQTTGEEVGIRARWRVVPNAIDTDRFAPCDDAARHSARERVGLGAGPLVVCVGRLCEQKGQDLLVSAWPAVERRVPGARLVLVGDGLLRPRLEAQAGRGIVFAGCHEDVRPWFAAADVVVQPSRYETLSLSTLEALACGRSVVATDVQGMREAIGQDAGAVVPFRDLSALADALVTRLRDPARAAAEGSHGRARVERRFGLGPWGDAIARVTEECVRLESRSPVLGRGRRRSLSRVPESPSDAVQHDAGVP
jgi:glycosyltransferase involved in cell wall biosynthesis